MNNKAFRLPPFLAQLLDMYAGHVNKARYSAVGTDEPTEEDYEECLRVVAIVGGWIKKWEGEKVGVDGVVPVVPVETDGGRSEKLSDGWMDSQESGR